MADGRVVSRRPGTDLYEPVVRAIRRHRLHAGMVRSPRPVDVSRLLEGYECVEQDLDPNVLAWAYMGRRRRIIGVNVNYHPFLRRVGMMHEVTHHLLQHPNSLYFSGVDEWLHARLERQANVGAAMILVPKRAARQMATRGASLREIADVFEVPE